MAGKQYVVIGACAYLTGTDPMTGASYRQLFYQGTPVPAAATAEEIEHNLEVGLIAEVDPTAPVKPVRKAATSA